MKALRIALISLPVAVASAAIILLRPVEKNPSAMVSRPVAAEPVVAQPAVEPPVQSTNDAQAAGLPPIQPLEERGDAMLFEIDALQNTPFDQAVTMPFD